MEPRAGVEQDQLRAGIHGMWASVAAAWGEHAAFADARAAAASERLLDLAGVRPGERVLVLASGPGGLGLAAAERVGPGGEVVVSDVAAEMTAIASERARALGLANVSARVLDLEEIEEPDESYDAVLCREGLMFAVDPACAAREIRRILRPGGRVALAVWGPRERNPWLGLVLDTVTAQTGAPMPPPGVPGPFALEDAARLDALLSGAGLSDVEVEELAVPMHADSFDEWWTRTTALAGPLARLIAALPDETAAALRDRARAAVRPYETATGLDFPGVTLIASARRA